MNHGSLWTRWRQGVDWMWIDKPREPYFSNRGADWVMGLETRDRFHAKQGRSTARVILHAPAARPLSVYLKRHYRLTPRERILTMLDPAGPRTPAALERLRLDRVRALGVPTPEVVALGVRAGPRGRLECFLMIAELESSSPLNEILPVMAANLDPARFERAKRLIVAETARITATLHNGGVFHGDLYLCHYFLEKAASDPATEPPKLALIDLHRAVEPQFGRFWRRWKDLGQLLYSTADLDCVSNRDRLRFLVHYRRLAGVSRPRFLARMVRIRAARYQEHNQKRRSKTVNAALVEPASSSKSQGFPQHAVGAEGGSTCT